MTTLNKILETIHAPTHRERHHKRYEFDADLNSWVRLDAETEDEGAQEEHMVIEKDQGGYWFAW